jgi:DNA-binding CsgD family transcriptional regulator
MFLRRRSPGPHTLGFQPRLHATLARRWSHYEQELSEFSRACRAEGVGVDVEFFGNRRLERLSYYQELMRPHRGRSTMIGDLVCGGTSVGKVLLGRCSTGFNDRERDGLKGLLPALSVCELALAPFRERAPAGRDLALASLTPREREVVSYLELGLTNAQIALACGSAPRTVRNQLSSVFAKLGVATRAEAVALVLGRDHR